MIRMNRSRLTYLASAFSLVLFQAAVAAEPRAEDLEFFEKRIRPVLVKHCYECHAADSKIVRGGLLLDAREAVRKGGDSGPAVVPKNVGESLLVSAIKYEDFEMPPDGKLPDNVIADFVKWVEMGAPDPRDGSPAPATEGIDLEKGRQHWAYQPIEIPDVAGVNDESWPQNAIDRFVLAKLEQHNLRPAAAADPEVLLRRIYYDLIGLPPSPAEVAAFRQSASDNRQLAVETVVDRLLASPRFGERWGRHWLDVVRFGESNTLRGTVFGEAWRYRDYVIDAVNDDRPFDQFVKEQVAGDLLSSDDWRERRRQRTATTMLALGNTNFENQDKAQLRMDVVDEQLEVIGRAFLAQTITCARCHDHKFDPIPTRDYYALAGILRNTKTLEHANVSRWLEVVLPVDPATQQKIDRHQLAVKGLQEQIAAAKKTLASLGQQPGTAGPKSVAIDNLAGIVMDDANAAKQGGWQNSTYSPRFVNDGYIHDANAGKGQKSVTFEVQLPAAGEYEVRMSYTSGTNRATNTPVTVWHADGESRSRINQKRKPPIDGMFISLGKFSFSSGEPARVVVSNRDTNGHVIVDSVQFLDGKALANQASETNSRPLAEDKAKQAQIASAKSQLKKLEADLEQLQASAPARGKTMSVLEESEIADTRIHIRGDVHRLGEEVSRGFLQVVSYRTTGEQFTNKESGRRQLGDWLVDESNPLTSRVTVNRLWHWLFGVGLVRTTDNFGTVGESPSHPELLDYLALRFQRDGWSVKNLLRQMVLSRTYQMSSKPTVPAFASEAQVKPNIDVENRMLWRTNRRRLEAEAIRDTMLCVAGRLSSNMHGQTYPESLKVDYDFQYAGPRRSVYAPVFRNSLPQLFEVFDFANPSIVVGRRSTSTVAPQALFMLNNPQVIELSRQSAALLWNELPMASDRQRVERAYRLSLGRLPTSSELRLALEFVAGADESSRIDVWGEFYQALFASLDFRYVD